MVLARRNVALAQATRPVTYITKEDAMAIAHAASRDLRKGQRETRRQHTSMGPAYSTSASPPGLEAYRPLMDWPGLVYDHKPYMVRHGRARFGVARLGQARQGKARYNDSARPRISSPSHHTANR